MMSQGVRRLGCDAVPRCRRLWIKDSLCLCYPPPRPPALSKPSLLFPHRLSQASGEPSLRPTCWLAHPGPLSLLRA